MNIKQKLITILLCVGLIPTIIVESVAYVTISNQLKANAASQLASIDIKQQQTISNLLQNKQEQVSELANSYNFQVSLANYSSQDDSADLASINSMINNQQLSDPTDIQAISVARPNGVIFASTLSGTTGQQMPSSILSLILSGNANAIAVIQDPTDGLDKLNITTTIIVNNQRTALVNVEYGMSDITAAVQDYTGLGQTGETIVASKNTHGNAISIFPLRFDTGAALTTNLNSLHLFANNPTTYTNVTDYRGHAVTVSARPIGFANWVIATKMDNQEIYAPINKLKDSLITITLISILLIIAIAWYMALFFSRPILSIANTARRIGQGELSARANIRQNDEVGTLGTSINAMGQNLKELVTRIEAQRNQLQIILDNTAEGIVAVDRDGRIIIANKAATDLAKRISGKLEDKFAQEVFNFTKDGKPFIIDYDKAGTNIYSDLQYEVTAGTAHFVKVIVSQADDTDNDEQTDTQAIITINDETKSRELEAMKVDFVSMAAHELRTPLAAVRGYIELLRFKELNNLSNGGAQYIEQALKSTKELGGLINNLLDVTRIERGTLTLHMEEVDLATIAHQAVEDSRFMASEKRVLLTYNGPDNGSKVVGDDVALHEIINNLLSNAIKYTPSDGKIDVILTEDDNGYTVSVKDTGYGIPKAALPNLFTKFYRVHGGLDSGSTGTGLGLFISKSIAKRHNGDITVESQEGTGSTFTFTMPKLTQERLDAAREQNKSEETVVRRHRGWVTQNINR